MINTVITIPKDRTKKIVEIRQCICRLIDKYKNVQYFMMTTICYKLFNTRSRQYNVFEMVLQLFK